MDTALPHIALDRDSVRDFDRDGRLHVSTTHISKACVNEYLGREIPKWQELGLEPERLYKLFRDPDELQRAAPTFNNLPLLSRHVPITAHAHRPDLVIGSTGTDAIFEYPYLDNSLVLWTAEAIEAVESNRQKELSSAYRYRADMAPGEFEGEKYDGVMRDIRGNHVALVEDGRAGSDVVVGDSKQEILMSKNVLSRKAAMLGGALMAYMTPKLAQDAKLDLGSIVAGVTTQNFKDRKKSIFDALKKTSAPMLAQDASIDDVVKLLDAVEAHEVVEDAPATAVTDPNAALPVDDPNKSMDADPLAKIKEFLKGKLSDEDMAALEGMLASDEEDEPASFEDEPKRGGAMDADKDKDKDKDMVTKPAMDAAIKAAKAETVKTQREVRDAERRVRPYIGELAVAMDSADEIYKHALTTLGVKVDGIHPSAFPAILDMQPKPGDKKRDAPVIAMDASQAQDFAKRYPETSRITTL